MSYKLIKKWFLPLMLFLVVLSIAVLFLVDYEVNKMWGAHTKIVDHTKFSTQQEKIVITNIDVLSPDGSKMIIDQTVTINNGKITSINSYIDSQKNTRMIDGDGKYLIPGLIDSHVHLWQSPNDLLLYIANGITHIREMNGSEEHLLWKQQIKEGRIGPDMFVVSSRLFSNGLFKGWFDHWTAKITSLNVINDAENVIQSLADKGFDAIKIGTRLNKQDYLAVNKASNKIGIAILGHIPRSIIFKDFWHSNQKELTHIEEIFSALDREFGGYNSQNANTFLQFVVDRSKDIASKLLKNKVAVVSTLWLNESFIKQKFQLEKIFQQVQLAYVNPGITEGTYLATRAMGWLGDKHTYRLNPNLTQQRRFNIKIYWETYAKAQQVLLRAMIDQGVQVLAGTDTNVPVVVPGFSLHDELKSLTKAGMSPAQALYSATAAPASWMKIKSGKIALGYKADLVLLNKNPLIDIENTKTIDTVIVNGKVLDHQKLDAMLDAVLKANNASRHVDISSF